MLDNLTLVLIGISVLFLLFLILRNFSKKLCAICMSVSSAWIILLILYFMEIFTDRLIIGILMGMSAIGLFYLLHDKLSVFKLPFILTLIFLIYSVLENFSTNSLYLLISLWVFFGFIYLFKSNKNFSGFVNKLIECCKKW